MTERIEDIAGLILKQAVSTGGATWNKIKASTKIYVRAYAQAIATVASTLAAGKITQADAKMHAENALGLLALGITHTSHVLLIQVQAFINGVIGIVKDAINAALPIAIL